MVHGDRNVESVQQLGKSYVNQHVSLYNYFYGNNEYLKHIQPELSI